MSHHARFLLTCVQLTRCTLNSGKGNYTFNPTGTIKSSNRQTRPTNTNAPDKHKHARQTQTRQTNSNTPDKHKRARQTQTRQTNTNAPDKHKHARQTPSARLSRQIGTSAARFVAFRLRGRSLRLNRHVRRCCACRNTLIARIRTTSVDAALTASGSPRGVGRPPRVDGHAMTTSPTAGTD